MEFDALDVLIEIAIREDLREAGDVTTAAIFTEGHSKAYLVSKSNGVLSGSESFRRVLQTVDPAVIIDFFYEDGSELNMGDRVAVITGKTRSILTAERTALNFIGFLSGIATATKRYVQEASEKGEAVILDTRKTLPGFRALSKKAVRDGGGRNHRIGLFDMVLIKDNHIDQAGSIAAAVKKVKEKWGDRYRIEVECRTIDEVRQAVETGVSRIMLDNMDIANMKEAVDYCKNVPVELEASGNMDLDRIADVSEIGVDFISVGSLTHSVKAFDFSLLVETEKEKQ